MTVGQNVFRHRIHFEAVDIGPKADIFMVETLRMEAGQMYRKIIG